MLFTRSTKEILKTTNRKYNTGAISARQVIKSDNGSEAALEAEHYLGGQEGEHSLLFFEENFSECWEINQIIIIWLYTTVVKPIHPCWLALTSAYNIKKLMNFKIMPCGCAEC